MDEKIVICDVCNSSFATSVRWSAKRCSDECKLEGRRKQARGYSKKYREIPENRDRYLAYMKEYHKTYDEKNREEIANYKKEWYEKNKERLNEKSRLAYYANYDERLEQGRARYKANREAILESRRVGVKRGEFICMRCGRPFIAYFQTKAPKLCSQGCVTENRKERDGQYSRNDPEKVKEYQARYRKKSFEHRAEYNRRHRESNRELYNSYAASRRALKLSLFKEDVFISDLLVRSEGKCGICNGEIPPDLTYGHPLFPTIDHIIPLSEGGQHAYSNTQAAHASCNFQKGNKLDGWQDIKPILNQEEQA